MLIVAAALLSLSSQAFAQAICANPGSSGSGTISGVVNTYFSGNGNLAATATTLTLGALDARGAPTLVAAGDLLLIIEMQDATINSSNSSSYGDGATGFGSTSVGSTGLHEFVKVTAPAIGTAGAGAAITFTPALANSYTQAPYGATGQKSYQVIRVPQYASATASGITTPAWDGTSGGVISVDVRDALTLGGATVEGQTNRAFFAAGRGFRGAAGIGSGTSASNLDWAVPAGGGDGGKGEGIAGTPRFYVTKNQWGFQTTQAANTAGALVRTDTGVEGYPGGSYARGAPGNAGGGGTDGNPLTAGGAKQGNNNENAGGGGGGN
ncbi:MAG: hypothetical protein ABI846_12605, partial [Rudaea sp.]